MISNSYEEAGSPSAIASFGALGREISMLALTNIPLGPLADYDRDDLDFESLSPDRISPYQARYFCELGESILELLSGGETVISLVQEKFYGSDRFEEGFGVSTSRHVFNKNDISKKSARISSVIAARDGGMHIDVPHGSHRGAVYALHLTTAGSGTVQSALGGFLPVENRSLEAGSFMANKEFIEERGFVAGDAHIFIRQGTMPNPLSHMPKNYVCPTSHHFISDEGGRSFVDNSFAFENEWLGNDPGAK